MLRHPQQTPSAPALVARRFFADRRGQDLVEYALLVAFIGVASLAAAPAIQTGIQQGYAIWNENIQQQWDPPAPAGS